MSKLQTVRRIMREEGLQSAVIRSGIALGKWWRQGEPWQISKSNYVRIDGCRIGLDNPIALGFRDLLTTAQFEWPERKAIRKYLNPALPVVELGGCIGVVACVTNQLLNNKKQHVVVEANPDVAPILEANRERNRAQFSVVRAAVGYDADFVEFHVDDANLLASSSELSGGRKVRVPAVRLRDILTDNGFKRFTLVCDIEGTEVEMVQNDSSVLASMADLIVMEVHAKLRGENKINDMLRELQRIGFEIAFQVKDTYVLKNRNIPQTAEMQ